MSELITATKTMLSNEIAALTGKQHKHVLRDIEVIIEQLQDSPDLGSGFKSTTYLAGNGKQERCFELDHDSTILVVTGYDVVARMKVIKRWQELEQVKPLSQLEVLAQTVLALVEIDKRQSALEGEVKLLAAKIEKSPTDYFTVAGFASLRGIRLDVSEANKLGRKASKASATFDYPIGKAHSEIFGTVNTYHIDILGEVFTPVI